MINTRFSRATFKLNQQEIIHYRAIFGPSQKKKEKKIKSCTIWTYFILRRSHKADSNITFTVKARGTAEDAEECRNAGN